MNQVTRSTAVLIVGAGPTGLVLGCQLQARGVDVRLIDALAEPVTTSRAFTIHARTLELLRQLGLAETFMARGHETYSMDYHFPGQTGEAPRLDFRALDCAHPYCLTINQVDTEAILRERFVELGGVIEWNTRLDSFDAGEQQVVVDVSRGDGTSETIAASWLVGCDGIASTVRRQLAFEFDGSEYAGTMRMIDAPLTGYPNPDDAIHYHIAKDHMLLVTKLPGANYRVLVSDKSEGVPPEQAREAFQGLLDRHFDGSVQLGEPKWSTNFRISKRLTNQFRRGRVFLAGDAAHVNSPAGGQGMNVAMQDAFNLGWKLAAVSRGECPASLLDSYASERQPVAMQMLEGTSYIHSIIMAHGQGMTERIERMRGGEWNAEAVSQVAGISYTYRDPGVAGTLEVGDRAPDGELGDRRIYDWIGAEGFTVFLFADEGTAVEGLRARAEALESRYRAPVRAQLVCSPALSDTVAGALVDPGELSRRYRRAPGVEVSVVRPDLHVAYLGGAEGLETALDALAIRA